jgi:hypothetical protein
VPPKGWSPDPAWPDPPSGWQLWIPEDESTSDGEANHVDPVEGHADTGKPQPADDAQRRIAMLEAENAALRSQFDSTSHPEAIVLDDEAVLQEVGIYRYHHPLENAVAYKQRLTELSRRIVDLVKSNHAIEMSNMFTFDNSLAKGRRMSSALGKLMLRAYNAEADNCIRSLRAGSVAIAKRRIEASRRTIKKLGQMMEMHISDAFHQLRLEEIELTADYLMKRQEEREAAKEERARLREQRKVEAELAAEREQLDKERAHLLNALQALESAGGSDDELQRRLIELDEAIVQNDYRAANVRAGYVYVISNRGAFGANVMKIGLTRRLEPIERINELSSASVPFHYDIHAIYFSEDAVTLEAELHQHFSDQRVNCANRRKEFFFASPKEVQEVLASKTGNLLEFTEQADSADYLQSIRYWPEEHRAARRGITGAIEGDAQRSQ